MPFLVTIRSNRRIVLHGPSTILCQCFELLHTQIFSLYYTLAPVQTEALHVQGLSQAVGFTARGTQGSLTPFFYVQECLFCTTPEAKYAPMGHAHGQRNRCTHDTIRGHLNSDPVQVTVLLSMAIFPHTMTMIVKFDRACR